MACSSALPTPSPSAPRLEPLKGEVCVQYIRCNKAGCRCGRGDLHGPYHYRVWREGGSVRKAYVRPNDLAAVRAACDAYKAMDQRLRELRRQRGDLVKHISGAWRVTQRGRRQWNRQTFS